ncbi:MAG: hypothetical protein V7636_1904 [Actinomycetota bacterium]
MTDVYAPPPTADLDDDPGPGRSTLLLVLGLVAALLLVVGVVAAIGGKDDSDKKVDAAALLSGAPDAVREAGSARISMSMSMKASGVSIDVRGDGVTDFTNGKGSFTMSILGIDLETVSDGTTTYIHVPDGGKLPGATKPWVSVPNAGMSAGGGSFSGLQSATGMLDALRGIGGTIRTIGDEKVNGVGTTHYNVVVRLADAIAAAPESQRAQAKEALDQLDQLGASEMPVDVWITDDGIPVRQVMTFDGASGVSALAGLKMKVTVDLSDFGAPVKVDIPPADQVQQIDPAQLGSLFGGPGGLPGAGAPAS